MASTNCVDPGYGVYENMVQARAAGVRALLLKNHYEPTAALALLLRPQFTGLELYAGFVFNRSNGGVNVPGVEYMASIRGEPKPGRIVWLPAGDTEREAKGGRNPNPDAPFVAVSKNGQLVPEMKQTLAVIAKNDLTLASGHVVPEDALLAFREATDVRVQRWRVRPLTGPHADSSWVTTAQCLRIWRAPSSLQPADLPLEPEEYVLCTIPDFLARAQTAQRYLTY